MGTFLAVSALRADRVDRVSEEIGRFFAECGWPVSPVSGGPVDPDNDVLVFAPVRGWTVVLWPTHFIEVAAAQFLSGSLGVLASTVRIHDGDYWSHTLFHNGQELDQFASMPDYHTGDPDEIARLSAKWSGNPSVVAGAFGVPVEVVAAYFADLLEGTGMEDDVFDLDDPWVFIDFWRRLGIIYPADIASFAARLRIPAGWLGKLPTGDAEL